MTALEIGLLIAGFAMIIGSFFLIEKFSDKELEKISKNSADEIRKITEQELENAKARVEEAFNEIFEEAEEKAERQFEKISNEKIMAVNEYSETVLEEINKNHKEVVFLYSMLCDKQEELKELVSSSPKKADIEPVLQTKPREVEIEQEIFSVQEPEIVIEEGGMVNNNQRILEFYQQGKPPVEIARELGLGFGEVKLVIDLFKGEK